LKNDPFSGILETRSSDKARINNDNFGIYGVQPLIFDTTVDDFLKVNWQSNSSLPLGE
jgi:hypothetical protein